MSLQSLFAPLSLSYYWGKLVQAVWDALIPLQIQKQNSQYVQQYSHPDDIYYVLLFCLGLTLCVGAIVNENCCRDKKQDSQQLNEDAFLSALRASSIKVNQQLIQN